MKLKNILLCGILLTAISGISSAHDNWLEISSTIVRVKDSAYVNLFLGNHGNEHRDFKLAGKPSLDKATWTLIDPAGKSTDISKNAIDRGLGEKEGFYTVAISPDAAGLYMAAYTSDKVVTYAPLRSIHSAKVFVLASTSLDKPPSDSKGFDRVLGHALELVPQVNPVAPVGPGTKMKVQVLFKGKPIEGVRVSFIPRGVTLADGFDEKYERKTDASGMATYEIRDANLYLIAAHHQTEEKGEGHDGTKYSATLTVSAPAICPCCGE